MRNPSQYRASVNVGQTVLTSPAALGCCSQWGAFLWVSCFKSISAALSRERIWPVYFTNLPKWNSGDTVGDAASHALVLECVCGNNNNTSDTDNPEPLTKKGMRLEEKQSLHLRSFFQSVHTLNHTFFFHLSSLKHNIEPEMRHFYFLLFLYLCF